MCPQDHASNADIQEQTDTTTITPSLSTCASCVGHATSQTTPETPGDGERGFASRFAYVAKASKAERGSGNNHPTVKPIKLMRYLCRLITPPGGLVLDPFTGSGSTGVAAMEEGFQFVGIEREAEYVAIAEARIKA